LDIWTAQFGVIYAPKVATGLSPTLGTLKINEFALKLKGRVKCKVRKTKSAVINGETRDEGVKSYPCGSAPCGKRWQKFRAVPKRT
jgi:hypothetical protein